MKILLDENLPPQLKQLLPKYPIEISHLYDFDLGNKPDTKIWEFAKKKNYLIVTKDKDFARFSKLYGHPPKVVLLKIGNTNIKPLKGILEENQKLFAKFIKSKTGSIIVLNRK